MGLIKRMSVERREVSSRANMVFITVVAHPLSMYTLQEHECASERKLAFYQLLFSISQVHDCQYRCRVSPLGSLVHTAKPSLWTQ